MHLRILTYNIHKCIGGLDRQYRPERIAETILHHHADIVLLQEVDEQARRSNRDRQVDLLGDMLGLRHRCYFPNVQLRTGGQYGNAVLSRFPVMEMTNVDLTVPPKKRRAVMHVRLRVRLGGRSTRTLHVYNLHLGLLGLERKLQLRRFLQSHPFRGLHHRTPVLVGGDFNDVYGTLGRKLLFPAGFSGNGTVVHTYPAFAPVRALDALYVRGDLRLHRLYRSRLPSARRASDHLPVIGEMELV